MPTRAEAEIVERFSDRYRWCCAEPVLAMEREVLGSDYGSSGYTTQAQADEIAGRLQLRSGGRLAFTTIHAAPGLDARQRRRAHRAGPVGVATRADYPTLMARAGFVDIVQVDVTSDYATTQRAWYEAAERQAEALRRLTSDAEFADAQADRRLTADAIAAGILRRSLFTATRA
jgi:hypothetical protein